MLDRHDQQKTITRNHIVLRQRNAEITETQSPCFQGVTTTLERRCTNAGQRKGANDISETAAEASYRLHQSQERKRKGDSSEYGARTRAERLSEDALEAEKRRGLSGIESRTPLMFSDRVPSGT